MLIESLNQKYNPRKWKDVHGQETVVKRLSNIIETEKIPKSMLFVGSTGTGKTTLAYLFARYLNEGNLSDVIEIDAGSDEGKVDAIRDLISTSKFKPMHSKYKIVIIDEAQKLTSASVSALYKPLESKDSHTVFILCSMEPEKLPPALFTRCSVFKLQPATEKDVVKRLLKIAKKENFKWLSEKYAEKIASNSAGSFRNAIAQLEAVSQAVTGINSKKELKEELDTAIENLEGGEDTEVAQRMLLAIYKSDIKKFQDSLLSVNNLVSTLNLMLQLNLHCINMRTAPNNPKVSRWPLLKEFYSIVDKKVITPTGFSVQLMKIHTDIYKCKQSIINTSSDPVSVAISGLHKYFKG